VVDEKTQQLLHLFQVEKERIIDKMKKAAPEPYENLLYVDYPDKNEARVNALACKKVTSDEAKKRICDQINEEIQPEVEAKTAEGGPMAQMAARKAAEKTVEKLVDEAVKTFANSKKESEPAAKSHN
jgi:hypothetical protein